MFSIPLSAQSLGSIIWRYLLVSIEHELLSGTARLACAMEECEQTRTLMSKKTGSISFSSSVILYSIVRTLKPNSIFELGTFIGNSTVSMALAMEHNGSGMIYTCDGDNGYHVPPIAKTKIYPYPRTNSLDALQDVSKREKTIDLFFLDGRITHKDAELIARLANECSIIVLDDFEGMEKGVCNLMLLRSISAFSNYVLIHPPSLSLLGDFGLRSTTALAMLLPRSALRFTAQDSPFSK
jgi:predicted O-methyltransferase YrrM